MNNLKPQINATAPRETSRSYSSSPSVSIVAARIPGHQIPPAMTPLIGRQAELSELKSQLDDPSNRMLTLTGAGGVGITRLAVALFEQLAPSYGGRAWFVSMVSVIDPALVSIEIARAIAGTNLGSLTPFEAIDRAVGDECALIVLDNFEHLISAATSITDLLVEFPQLRLIVTSREALRIRAERIYAVPSLSLDGSGSEALDLFNTRVTANRPQFNPSLADLTAIPEICRRLDGLPLAIELAAARCRAISPAALLDRMGTQLDVLSSGPRDLPDRQRTMRSAIAWSYDALSDEEQSLFDFLGVFASGFSLEVVEDLWTDWSVNSSPTSALDLLESLALKSLIVSALAEYASNSARFMMMETLRAFAVEKLTASGRVNEARTLHTDWYLSLAESSVPELTGPQRTSWLDRLDSEMPNLRVAQAWTLEQRDAERALRFVEALWRFWEPRGHMQEGETFARQAIALPTGHPISPLRAAAHYGAGIMPFRLGDFEPAGKLVAECLAIFRALNDADGIARGLNGTGLIAFELGDFARAEAAYLEGLALAERLDNPHRMSATFINLGLLYVEQGRLDDAWAIYMRAHDLNSGPDHVYDFAYALNGLGIVCHRRGDFDGAIAKFGAAVEIRRRDRDSGGLAASLTNLGAVCCDHGSYETALDLLQESLAMRWARGELRGTNEALAHLARLAAATRHREIAARWLGVVSALSDRGQRLPRFVEGDLVQTRLALHKALGDDRFDIAFASGKTASLGHIIDEAIAFSVQEAHPAPAHAVIDSPLTAREIDVIRLLAEGKSDREIGEDLHISRNTVTRHVANIFLKLDINSRTLAAMYAFQHGLVEQKQ